MKKAVFALLAIFALAASFAAAQTLSPLGLKAADLNVANNAAPASSQVEPAGKALGLKADKPQCMCSADTLAKIEQIKKLLAELEQSCVQAPPVVQEKPYSSCVDTCLTEQKPYCESTCKKEDGSLDSACFNGCYAGIKQKCVNSCGLQPTEQKPTEAGCVDTCMAKSYDKEGCLSGCSAEDVTSEGPCYTSCKDKAAVVFGMCQKQCNVQETTTASTQTSEVLSQCSASCELKYSDCKQNCQATSGVDAPKLNSCVEQQCMPLLKQCSVSCNSQYAPKETFVEKVVNVFKPAQYRNAKWICYDGTESVEGGDTSCKPSETWSGYAKQACEGKCSAETNKCGVNSFLVYNEC